MRPNKSTIKRFFRRVTLVIFTLMLILAATAGGGYAWALMATDTSLTARGIVWGDSKYDDWKRYPQRMAPASEHPVYFEKEETDIFDDFTIDNRPLEAYLAAANTTALIILHDDALLYEGYFNGSSREGIQASFSATKSFVSTLVGIAIDEGLIGSLDDPVSAYIPELLERDPRFEYITLRNLIMMTSGIRFDRDESNPFSDDFITSRSPDIRSAALETEIVEAPGQRFHYNDYNPQLIGMVLERAAGMSVTEYLATRLWRPMGAEGDGSWDLDSEQAGFERMSIGINGRAIDFAKLGWLFLHEGKNGDRQVIPGAWVEQIVNGADAIYTARAEHANYYQHYWWLDVENEALYSEGDFCQFIYIHPPADLVIVRHGMDCGSVYWTRLLGEIAQTVESELSK